MAAETRPGLPRLSELPGEWHLANSALSLAPHALPDSLPPGSICLAGTDSCGNRAKEPGRGEQKSVRIEERRLGGVGLGYPEDLTGL